MMKTTNNKSLFLPLQDDAYAVEIPLNRISENIDQIAQTLQFEFAPLRFWHRLAIELHRQFEDTKCQQLLKQAIDYSSKYLHDELNENALSERIDLINSASIQCINQSHDQKIFNSNNTGNNNIATKPDANQSITYFGLSRSIAEKQSSNRRSKAVASKYDQHVTMVFLLHGLISIFKKASNNPLYTQHNSTNFSNLDNDQIYHQWLSYLNSLTLEIETAKDSLEKQIEEMEGHEIMGSENKDENGLRSNSNEERKKKSFILLLGKACLCYTIGEYEHSLQTFKKLLEDWKRSTPPYIHLGIGLCCLKLQRWDIARLAFLRSIRLDHDTENNNDNNSNNNNNNNNNNNKGGYISAKAHLGLALVYLNQANLNDHECETLLATSSLEPNDDNEEDEKYMISKRKLEYLQKALREVTEAWKIEPTNPQTLTLLANFVGFSWSDQTLVQELGGTAYHYCVQNTKMFDQTPTEDDVMKGIENTWVGQLCHTLQHNYNTNVSNPNGAKMSQSMRMSKTTGSGLTTVSVEGDLPLSRCMHPLLQCQAEACYVLGKMYHCQKDYRNAMVWYYKSVMICPYLELSLFGLAQMYLTPYFFNIKHCRQCLERIVYGFSVGNHTLNNEGLDSWVNKTPTHDRNIIRSNSNVLKLLSYCYMKDKDFKNAQKYLLKAIDLNPQNDIDLWLLLGKCTESIDTVCSLNAYEKAVELITKKEQTPVFELFNNIVVLHYKLGRYADGKDLCEKVLFPEQYYKQKNNKMSNFNNDDLSTDKLESQADIEVDISSKAYKYDINPDHMVLYYNYGLILQALGEEKKCYRIMVKIVKMKPDFIEAILVIGVMYRKQGNISLAISYMQKAAEEAQKRKLHDLQIDARLLLAETLDQQRDRNGVREQLRAIAEDIQGGQLDPYSILLKADMLVKTRNRDDLKKGFNELMEAAKSYTKVLVSSDNNVLAAHGLGVIYAELGELERAKSIFQELREATNMPELSINLGNIYAAHKHWDGAIKLYEKALRQLPIEEHGDVPNYLARALFAKREYKRCKQVLLKALRHSPTSEIYLFNYAYACEMQSIHVLRQENADSLTLFNAESALESLKTSLNIFENLQQHYTHIGDDMKNKIIQHIAFVNDTISRTVKIVSQKQRQFAKKQEMKEKENQILEDLKKQRNAEQQQQEKNEELKRKEFQIRARKRKREVESISAKLAIENEEKKMAKALREMRQDGIPDDNIDSFSSKMYDQMDEPERNISSKRRKFNGKEELNSEMEEAISEMFDDDQFQTKAETSPSSQIKDKKPKKQKRLQKNMNESEDHVAEELEDLFGENEEGEEDVMIERDHFEKMKEEDNDKDKITENDKDKKKKKFEPALWEKMSIRIDEIIKTTPNSDNMTMGSLKKQLGAEFAVNIKPYKDKIKGRAREIMEKRVK